MLLFILLVVFIVIALGLAWFLIAHDRGEREPIGALWMAVGFGLIGGFVAGFAEGVLPSKYMLPGAPAGGLLAVMLGVGFIEELCKFLPLALVLYRKRYFNEHTDGVIYFALAGLGFGVPENIMYTLSFGAHIGLGRILLTPFFHAATCGMVGFFLAKRKLAHKSAIGVWPALLAAMVLHGIYDFGLTTGNDALGVLSILITLLLSAGLFIFYERANDLDQDMGLSVVGNNSFCRSCGYPNPKHLLYCTHCGKNA